MLRTATFGLAAGLGLAVGLTLLSTMGRVASLEKRVGQVETRAVSTSGAALRLSSRPQAQDGPPAAAPAPLPVGAPIEVSGWFIEQPVPGPRGHYTVQPLIRNLTGRDIRMVQAFLVFRTRTGDVICAMNLTQNLSIPAGSIAAEPLSHRIGWEKLQKLNMTELRAGDIVADLQIGQVVFDDGAAALRH
jgi:hypothetical protein